MDHDEKKRKFEAGDVAVVNGSASLTREELKRLIEPLPKEQLIEMLLSAGSQYPTVAAEIRDVASKDPATRKLFVRDLAWETTSQTLRDAFTQYGEIEDAAVITEKGTNKSRGFGFVTFRHIDGAQRALAETAKKIDGRLTKCNLASMGSSDKANDDVALRKLYIGGLSFETTTETLLATFGQYGAIEEGNIAIDKNSKKSRGFAFITYRTTESARAAIAEPTKTIDGRNVQCKLAVLGQKDKAPDHSHAQQVVYQQQPLIGGMPAAYGAISYQRPQQVAGQPPVLGAVYATNQLAYGAQTGAAAPSATYGSTYNLAAANQGQSQYVQGVSGVTYGISNAATPQYTTLQQYAPASYGAAQLSLSSAQPTATQVAGALPTYYTGQ